MSPRSVLVACTAMCSLLPVGGCTTYGRVHLSQPEVHTRERLVSERSRESVWIRAQLDRTEEAGQGMQGYLDTRRFTGLFAELRASLDPDQGERNEPRQARIVAQAEARAYDARTDELAARQRYEQALEDFEQGKPIAPSSSQPGEPLEDPSVPSAASAPLGRKLSDLPKLPAPKDVEISKVQRSALEAFHDKLAYRDAVNTALREAELDDAHDVFGHTLYELSFDLTLVPGKKSRDLVQISVELAPDAPAGDERLDESGLERLTKRQDQLLGLHERWLEGLRDEMLLDIRALQERVRSGGRVDESNQEAKWFLRELGPLLHARRLACEGGELSTSSTEGKDQAGLSHLEEIQDPDFLSHRPGSTVEGLGSESKTSQEKLLALDRAIVVAVWAAYASELARIVEISPPAFLGESNRLDPRSLRVSAVPPVATAKALGYEWAGRHPPSKPGSAEGAVLFVERLLAAEQRMIAIDVQPKEHAQTLSDVAARESVVNMLLALQAVLPTKGVSAAADLQHLRREQQLVHALARKPLLVGFGRGGPRFGWVAGPRLALVDGEPEFLHGPVRHDFAVSIAVPAWLTELRLRGRYDWLDRAGEPVRGGSLWGAKPVVVRLPMPEKLHSSITAALIGHSSTALSGIYRDTARPRPRVGLPAKNGHAGNRLVAGESGQSLLILGEHLWRNPQVFAGNQPASKVEVLASMGGLLAHFDGLVYPGPSTAKPDEPSVQDLHVITSYGRADVTSALGILPPRPKLDAKPRPDQQPPLVLSTYALSPEQSKLRLSFERPERYHAARVAFRPVGESSWNHVLVGAAWEQNGEIVVGLDPKPGKSCILELMLEVQPRQGAEFQPVTATPVRAAYFGSDADRHVKLSKGARIELDACGALEKDKETLEIVTPRVPDSLLFVAYPGLETAMQAKKLRIELSRDLRTRVLSIPVEVEKTDQVFRLSAPRTAFAQLAEESKDRSKPVELGWEVRLSYGEGSASAELPLLKASGNPTNGLEIQTVLAAIPGASATLVEGALGYRKEGDAPPALVGDPRLILSIPRRSPCLASLLHRWIGKSEAEIEAETRLVVRKPGSNDLILKLRVKHEEKAHLFVVSKGELEHALASMVAMLGAESSGELSVLLQHLVDCKLDFEVEASEKLELRKK